MGSCYVGKSAELSSCNDPEMTFSGIGTMAACGGDSQCLPRRRRRPGPGLAAWRRASGCYSDRTFDGTTIRASGGRRYGSDGSESGTAAVRPVASESAGVTSHGRGRSESPATVTVSDGRGPTAPSKVWLRRLRVRYGSDGSEMCMLGGNRDSDRDS